MKARWFLIGVFLLWSSLSSVASGEDTASFPDMALLEFLGSWETEEGAWIDPMLFRDGQVQGLKLSEEPNDPQGLFGEKSPAEHRGIDSSREEEEGKGKGKGTMSHD